MANGFLAIKQFVKLYKGVNEVVTVPEMQASLNVLAIEGFISSSCKLLPTNYLSCSKSAGIYHIALAEAIQLY